MVKADLELRRVGDATSSYKPSRHRAWARIARFLALLNEATFPRRSWL